jgi:diaminohydroxyphosphoribosylaminopyrimidine deaminase/5-amino-6-(5-phosphoribosylamino)uracil reductase
MVGAVVVRAGEIIAEGYHEKAGMPHAEAVALARAGARAKGATLYVTLEPCCHTDKRTPPCTRAIIEAGISEVVVAMLDPNPKVAGKGVAELRAKGISVRTGVMEREARELNRAYAKFIATRMPYVILKAAMTLDGRIATPDGESKWITGERARRLVHKLRSEVDAVVTAIGTVKADDPELTARVRGGRDPLRVIIDPSLETPDGAKVLRTPPPTLIVTCAPGERAVALRKAGVELLRYEGRLNLRWLMEELGGRGIVSVLIEGGASLNAHAFEDGVIDWAMFFIAPKVIGGSASIPVVGGASFRRLSDAYTLHDARMRKVGGDFLIEGAVSTAR